MNANHDLERRIADFYETEAPLRAPDWVLGSALETIDTTKQRRVLIRGPWRFLPMNTHAKLAVVAVAVVAVGLVGLAVLRPGATPGPGGTSGPSPAPVASPSPSPITTQSPSPTPFIPPALTETFTSAMHGISISYPSGWTVRAATEPWTSGIPFQSSPFGDVIDAGSNRFLGLASQALAGRSGDSWISEISGSPDWGDACEPDTEPVTLDNAVGAIVVHCDRTLTALASVEDRGYLVVLYGIDDLAWFKEILATVQLHPEDALDAAPSASPAGS